MPEIASAGTELTDPADEAATAALTETAGDATTDPAADADEMPDSGTAYPTLFTDPLAETADRESVNDGDSVPAVVEPVT